ncbi:MAG: hypothetical protein D6696_07285 [Acidobacteria bacterium]|nr:MAG: hypothetical protein D6696_07285 [Acidobacteriota bacterium]
MTTIRARAWCRADLAGGTLDIWPLGLLHDGARTINVALDLAATVTLRRRRRGYVVSQGDQRLEAGDLAQLAAHEDARLAAVFAAELGLPPVSIELASASPRGAGLGASSALAIALLAAGEALNGRPPASADQRAVVARDLEARMMGLPTGVQDHYPALYGGALAIAYRPGTPAVRRLAVDLEALAASLLIAYSGQSHFSAGSNWQVVRRRLDGEPEVVAHLEGIAGAAADLEGALEAGDLERAGALMSREWHHRRQLAPGVSTPAVEELLRRAAAAGAWGGKVCGAGGGGSIAVLCPPARRDAVASALVAAGGRLLDARPAAEPLAVEVTS